MSIKFVKVTRLEAILSSITNSLDLYSNSVSCTSRLFGRDFAEATNHSLSAYE